MTTVGSSTSAVVANGTSVSFTLAASVGDLLVVVLALDTPRNVLSPSVYQPGVADSWVPLARTSGASDSQNQFLNLYVMYKTVNATDAAGGTYTFNTSYINDPSGTGQNFPTTNIAGVMVRFLSSGAGNAGMAAVAPQGHLRGAGSPFPLPLLTTPLAGSWMSCAAVLGPSASALSSTDPGASTIQTANQSPLSLAVFFNPATSTNYPKTITATNAPTQVATAAMSLRDTSSWKYTAPFVRESVPSSQSAHRGGLLERFPYHQGFTVVNNGGIFSATRFYSQDQLAAATQTFTGTQDVTTTDRTNILNSSAGGDFLPS